ncbi:ATP-NAD kinase-like domain-containing protein [Parasitella parasitica]|nr:ATP-NAD kinase-like domain-containing protein [Parasitella parasitica]
MLPANQEAGDHHKDKPILGQDFAERNSSPTPIASANEALDTPPPSIEKDNNADPDKRPSAYVTEGKIHNSVKLDDTVTEGRPSIYLFIFVNPLSGDRKGSDLINLPIQHFRLRKFPQVQVEVHNILDDEDRMNGVKNIQLVEAKLNFGQLPPLEPQNTSENKSTLSANSSEKGILSNAVQTRQIHVWSAGGDGTVMSVFELLVTHKIDLDLVFFSCIPFGTGNDFSQVLGWGRTIPDKNILGSKLQNLEELIAERLEKSEAARLDIWQIKMSSYPSGYVREAGPKERKDGHDVAEVKEPKSENKHDMVRKMSNYMSIGVQGFVGSGFEAHRAGNRLMNMMIYAHESSKWVFWRRFPDLTHFIKSFTQNGEKLLDWPTPEEKKAKNRTVSNLPEISKDPIDLVIQNIPHIWGREVDLWGEAESGLESVLNRSGPCDPNNWKPQRANDGRLEVMSLENMTSYLKKLANFRNHVSRIGQFDSPFEINFREPEHHMKKVDKVDSNSAWVKAKAFVKDMFRHKYEKKNIMCVMCDGEFYEISNPKSISFNRFAQIWTLGRNDEENQGRLVKDELDYKADNANSTL